jgi:hypothetical protein
MHSFGKAFFSIAAAFAFFGGQAHAGELKEIGSISIPGEKLTSWDISFVDQASQRYFLADHSNQGVDVFDTKGNKYLGRIAGFAGRVIENGKWNRTKSGPNGVTASIDRAWAGDGDSTLKFIDLKAMKITDAVSTGAATRVDNVRLDPQDDILIAVNGAEDPPFATLFSTKPDHQVLAKLVFPNATDGAEGVAYNPADGFFYVNLPELDKDSKKGAVAVVDPRARKVVNMLPYGACHPHGIAFGPDQNFALGCSVNGEGGLPPVILVMNAKAGTVVATIAEIGGADMVAYSAKNNQYYVGGWLMPGGGVIGVIDAKTNQLVQKLPLPGALTPRSLAVDDNTGHVFVPSNAEGGGCGCIKIFAPQ